LCHKLLKKIFEYGTSLVENVLSCDQVAGVLDFVQGSFDVPVPRIKLVVGELALVVEHNDALQTVNFSRNALIDHHVTNLSLSPLQ